ncbi:MAG: serine hydrolase domain-containing protein [Psychroflexus halocasei]
MSLGFLSSKKLFTVSLVVGFFVIINYAFSSHPSPGNNSFTAIHTDVDSIAIADITKSVKVKKSRVSYEEELAVDIARVSEKLKSKASRLRFNGSLLIAYKDQVIFDSSYGYKDPINKTEIDSSTSFELASVSKQFTAAAIMKLYDDELLDLNESVTTYLSGFKFPELTVKDLLKHRSGLWNYMYMTEAYWKKDEAPNNFDVVKLINQHQTSLSFRPGSRFKYNNTNYVLLAAIVESVSGTEFEDYLEEEFFKPLNINETYVGLENRDLDNVAKAYQAYGRGYVKLAPSFHNGAVGDKGVYASADNLWRWFKAIKNAEILKPETVDLMFNSDEFDFYKYGIGYRTKKDQDKRIIYHNGIWDGYRNGLTFVPDEDLVVITLSNTQNRNKRYFQSYVINKLEDVIENYELTTEKLVEEKI